MRVVIGGKGWLAVRAARLLGALTATKAVEAGTEIVRNSGDPGEDTWLPSLTAFAVGRGWPVHRTVEDAGLGPDDVFLSLQHDKVVDCDILNGAAAYNLHFADLPRYRGSLTSALPLRHGETKAGVTLHVLVPTVDAGPVIAARTFPLPPFCTAYDLYRAYHRHGFELLKDNLESLLTGTAVAVPQDESAATTFYRSSVDFSEVELTRFDRSAEEVRDWCRALIFPPAQHPTFRGREIRSCFALRWGGADGAHPPGTVIHDDQEQAIVACGRDLVCLEFQPG